MFVWYGCDTICGIRRAYIFLLVPEAGFQNSCTRHKIYSDQSTQLLNSDTIDVVFPYGKWFIWGVPVKSRNIRTCMSLDVIGRKSDNHSIPILSGTNTFSLWFMYSDWFANSEWYDSLRTTVLFSLKLIHRYGWSSKGFVSKENVILPNQSLGEVGDNIIRNDIARPWYGGWVGNNVLYTANWTIHDSLL